MAICRGREALKNDNNYWLRKQSERRHSRYYFIVQSSLLKLKKNFDVLVTFQWSGSLVSSAIDALRYNQVARQTCPSAQPAEQGPPRGSMGYPLVFGRCHDFATGPGPEFALMGVCTK